MDTSPADKVVDFVVNKGHGVLGLARTGLKHVPQNYIQPLEERHDATKGEMANELSIPVIDISDLEGVAGSICDAATEYGFFKIINHGVAVEVCDEVLDGVHRFFGLPTEEKVKYKGEGMGSGGTTFGTSFSPENEKVLEWKDCLGLHYTHSEGVHVEDVSLNWPPICRNEALKYHKSITQVVEKILDVLLKGMGVKTGFDESKRCMLMGWIAMNFNYYPKCPNPDLTVGIGRHSDASALTVVLQDDVGGLYMRSPKGESWIHIQPKRGELVINIGDVLQVVSNGRYKSVEHRVFASASRDRVWVAVFASPGFSQLIGPLPEVGGVDDTLVYRHVLYGDYCQQVFGRRLQGKKAIDWAMR